MILTAIEIEETVQASIRTSQRQQLEDYLPVEAGWVNEYCLFLKPELTTLRGKQLETALQILESQLKQFDQEVVASAVLPGRYLEKYDLMARHYSVINASSRLGIAALTDDGLGQIRQVTGHTDLQSSNVYGGHQFLADHQYFSPKALLVLHDSSDAVKVGPSTYAITPVVDGETVAVLNGFHPYQLEWFYRLNSAILVLVVRSKREWSVIRGEMTGSTLPAKARPETMRGQLLASQDQIGIRISPLKNGVHVSAGPLEGAVEIARYMSDLDSERIVQLEDTTFGRSAVQTISAERLERLSRNPMVRTGPRTDLESVFDLTEEMDAEDALGLLGTLDTER